MIKAEEFTGTLMDERTVRLDRAVLGPVSNVRVIVEQPAPGTAEYLHTIDAIWADQRARGYVPRNAEQILLHLQEERESWGDQ